MNSLMQGYICNFTYGSNLDKNQYFAIGNIPELKLGSLPVRNAAIVSIALQKMQRLQINVPLKIDQNVFYDCIKSATEIDLNFDEFKERSTIDTIIYELSQEIYKSIHVVENAIKDNSTKFVVLLNSKNVGESVDERVYEILLPRNLFELVEPLFFVKRQKTSSLRDVLILSRSYRLNKKIEGQPEVRLGSQDEQKVTKKGVISKNEFKPTLNDPESHGDIKSTHIINHFQRSSRSQRNEQETVNPKRQESSVCKSKVGGLKKSRVENRDKLYYKSESLLRAKPVEKKRKLNSNPLPIDLNESQSEKAKAQNLSIKRLMRSQDQIEEYSENDNPGINQSAIETGKTSAHSILFSQVASQVPIDELNMDVDINFNIPIVFKKPEV